jgi:acyl-CoA hydrolase
LTVPVDDGKCFACGPENPIGLHLTFEPTASGVYARVTLAPEFQGWQNIAHGGIAMSLIDEAMAHAAGYAGHRGVTASVNIRFRKPVPLGEPLDVYGSVTWHRHKVLGVEAHVVDARGTVLIEGEGKFVSMGPLDAVEDRRNPATT